MLAGPTRSLSAAALALITTAAGATRCAV